MKYIKFTGLSIIVLVILSIIALSSCSKKHSSVIAKIGDEKIYSYEFENSFLRLTPFPDSLKYKTLEQKREMLNQYINMRLKAKDAKDKGMLDSADLQNDINEYKKTLLISLFEDKNIVDPYIEKIYDRKKVEYRVSHILINLSQNPKPEDSVAAYNKYQDIITRLNNGEDFGKLAAELSDEIASKRSGGDLYYVTGGKLYPEIEDAIYELGVGDYTKKPVRTAIGLHILKVTAKNKRIDKIKVSHILIQDTRDSSGNIIDSLATIEKANQVLERIKKGEAFEVVAKEVSQDPGSKDRGGDLGYTERRRFVLPFDSAAFTLKLNQVSDIIRTQYGLHIIKLTGIEELPPFERLYESMKSEYKRGELYRRAYIVFMEGLRKKYNYKTDSSTLNIFYSKLDSSKSFYSFKWDSLFSETDTALIAVNFDGGQIKISDIIKFVKANNPMSGSGANFKNVNLLFEEVANQSICYYAAIKEKLENSDEFLELFNEFVFGLLKHKADQSEISSKLKLTEPEIDKYYNDNKNKYSYKDGDTLKYRTLDEVRSEISTELQSTKQKELDKIYVDALKAKYPVTIYDNILEKAFLEK